jgi:predicted deacylase
MGNKTTNLLQYKTACNEEILIPVAEIIGNNDGPVCVITAGLHGCEYPGIVSAIRLFKELKVEEVSGKITIIPVSSVKAFEERSMFVSPVDKINPNRVFPGKIDGSYSEALTYYLMKIIGTGNYHLDLHGGDMVEDLDPFSIYHLGGSEELNHLSFELAKTYGLPNIVSTKTDGLWPDNGTSYANVYEKHRIPSAIVEVGAMGVLDEDSVRMHLFGMKNVLRKKGNLRGEVKEILQQEEFDNMSWIYTSEKGIFYNKVKVGDYVEQGSLIGKLEDFFGNHIEDVISPVEGKVLFNTSSPAMKKKALIAGIGVAK